MTTTLTDLKYVICLYRKERGWMLNYAPNAGVFGPVEFSEIREKALKLPGVTDSLLMEIENAGEGYLLCPPNDSASNNSFHEGLLIEAGFLVWGFTPHTE